jgi:FKBP-type peptidyl-prolyl cis-trans isomerase
VIRDRRNFILKKAEGILLVPAHLGYGNSDYSGIPGGSVLILK